jgi:hypothetical protein
MEGTNHNYRNEMDLEFRELFDILLRENIHTSGELLTYFYECGAQS